MPSPPGPRPGCRVRAQVLLTCWLFLDRLCSLKEGVCPPLMFHYQIGDVSDPPRPAHSHFWVRTRVRWLLPAKRECRLFSLSCSPENSGAAAREGAPGSPCGGWLALSPFADFRRSSEVSNHPLSLVHPCLGDGLFCLPVAGRGRCACCASLPCISPYPHCVPRYHTPHRRSRSPHRSRADSL